MRIFSKGLSVTAALVIVSSLMATTAGAQTQRLCDGLVATIVGTSGPDVLTGTPGPDIISGLQGDDTISGLGGDDIICGGFGNDRIVGGEGFDIIFGAQGNDEIYAAGITSLFPPGVLDDVRGARIFAGAGDDLVYGSNRWDRMQGGAGDDTLYGFAGNDWMRGGPGADVLIGHRGSDDMLGGSGPDWVAGDRQDSNVRGGGGEDACPELGQALPWRGCELAVPTDAIDPTFPAFSVPAALSGGAADSYVFFGFGGGGANFVGLTDDLDRALVPAGVTTIFEITVRPLTRGQALAVQQAVLNRNPNFINTANAINPSEPFFADAVEWGEVWLALNGFG